MDTENYIKVLKTKKKQRIPVAMRQALVYFFYKNNIPVKVLANVLGISRMMAYKYIYKTQDLLDVKDKLMSQAYEEAKQHKMMIQPCLITGDIITLMNGYRLTIDNKVF